MTGAGAVLAVATLFTSLYPRVMVSSPNFANSLTVDNASSAHYTLEVMSVVAVILAAGRPPLPGLDVLRVPAAGSASTSRSGQGRPGGEPPAARQRARGLGSSGARPRPAPRPSRAAGPAAARRRRGTRPRRRRCSSLPRRSCSPGSSPARSTGRRLAALGRTLGLLVARRSRYAARCAWGFEAVGRRAATDVLSELRLDLVEQRLRGEPAALDGAESAEVATTAVARASTPRGVLRPLPASARARCRRAGRRARAGRVDRSSLGRHDAAHAAARADLHVARRPLHGASRRASAGRHSRSSATHFLDVVRGLPTLRAFNRGEAQARAIERGERPYRRATMRTLRVAFLSGAVLELASTLGVALIAVTVGVRLVEGSVAFRPALTVLVLAPELYLPLRNLGAQYHASADGLAVSERILELIEGPPPWPAVRVRLRVRVRRRSGWKRCRSLTPPGRPPCSTGRPRADARRDRCARRAERSGKSTVATLLLRLCEPTRGRMKVGGVDLADCDAAAWRAQLAWVPQYPTLFRGSVADNIRLGDPAASEERVRAAARLAGADGFVCELREGYETVVGEGGRRLSAGERQRSRLPARSSATRPSSSSTSRPRTSTGECRDRRRRRRAIGRRPHGAADRAQRRARRSRRPYRPARIGPSRRRRGGRSVSAILPRLVALAGMPARRVALSVGLGALAVAFGVGLMTTSGYLISRAAEQPAHPRR